MCRSLIALLAALVLAAGLLTGCGQAPEADSPPPSASSAASSVPEETSSQASPSAPEEEASLVALEGQTLRFDALGLTLTLDGEWTLLPGEMLDQIQQDAVPALDDQRLEDPEENAPLSQTGAMAVETNRSWTLFCSFLPDSSLSPLDACQQTADGMGELLTLLREPREEALGQWKAASFTGSYSQPEGGITVFQTIWTVGTPDGILTLTGTCGAEDDLESLEAMIKTLSPGES